MLPKKKTQKVASFLAVMLLTTITLVSCQFFPSSNWIKSSDIPLDDRFAQVPLVSAKNIDYRPLKTFLQKQQWQEADRETLQRLLQVAGQSERGWLSAKDVQNLPCADVKTIDQLWMRASHQRFGFTVQAHLWETLGGQGNQYNETRIKRLGDVVGWRKESQWKSYDSLTFDLRKAPPGHLPATTGNGVSGGVWGGVASIASRLQICGQFPPDEITPQWLETNTDPQILLWQLENNLANQQWSEADWVTLDLLKSLIKVDPYDDLSHEALENFPCKDLKAIDRLWTTYSNGKFGFSVQQALMPANLRPQAQGNASQESFEQFMKVIGWNWGHQSRPENPPVGFYPFVIGNSNATYGSGFDYHWPKYLNPTCTWE